MKKIGLLLTSFIASIGALFSQISPFVELPDSLNPFQNRNSNLNLLGVGDLNGDGLDDLIFYNQQLNASNHFQNDGNGNFTRIWPNQSHIDELFVHVKDLYSSYYNLKFNLEFADMDSDGDDDAIFNISSTSCNYANDRREFVYFKNDGAGTFDISIGDENEVFNRCGDNIDFQIIDIDLDGDTDFIAKLDSLSYHGKYTYVYHEWRTFDDLSQSFELNSEEVFDPTYLNKRKADLNNDGLEDLYTAESIYLNSGQDLNGDEFFDLATPISFNIPGQSVNRYSHAILDFEGDGFLEIIDLHFTGGNPLTDLNIYTQNCDYANGAPCGNENDCIATNFEDAPSGLYKNSNNEQTQLLWNHYSDASQACLIKGGQTASLDANAPFIEIPQTVIVKNAFIDGLPNGYDNSSPFGPDEELQLFNTNTFTYDGMGQLVPGAFYKWKVQCGCLINPNLTMPDLIEPSNVVLSPWSAYHAFENLELTPQAEEQSEIESMEKTSQISVFPNPISNEFRITWPGKENPLKVEVINQLGEKILIEDIDINNEFGTRLNSTEWSQGAYIILLHFQDEISVAKVLK